MQAKAIAAYGDLSVQLNGCGIIPLSSLTPTFTFEGQDFLAEQRLDVYHALMSQDCNLVNICSNVCYYQHNKVRKASSVFLLLQLS